MLKYAKTTEIKFKNFVLATLGFGALNFAIHFQIILFSRPRTEIKQKPKLVMTDVVHRGEWRNPGRGVMPDTIICKIP